MIKIDVQCAALVLSVDNELVMTQPVPLNSTLDDAVAHADRVAKVVATLLRETTRLAWRKENSARQRDAYRATLEATDGFHR
jgi:hypothetical protein